MPTNITVRLPSLEDLDAYAAQQWEVCNLLIYLCIFFFFYRLFAHLCISILFHCSLCKSVCCWPLVMCSFSILLAALFLTCNCWNQSFLLHLISSSEAETTKSISSSMIKVFQQGLLSLMKMRKTRKGMGRYRALAQNQNMASDLGERT